MNNQGRFGLIYYFLIVTVFILSSCGGGGGDSNNGSNVTPPVPVQPINPASLGYSNFYQHDEQLAFQYPENWQLLTASDLALGGLESDFVLGMVDSSSTTGYPANFVVVKQDLDTIDPYIDFDSEDELISTSFTTIAGMSAIRSLYDTEVTVAGVLYELRALSYEFELDGYLYGMVYVSERETFNRYADVAQYLATKLKVGLAIFESTEIVSATASNGSSFLALSCRGGDDNTTFLMGRVIEADGSQGNEFVIHSDNIDGLGDHCDRLDFSPSFDGVNYLVSYLADHVEEDGYSYVQDLVFKRISTSGQLIDIDPVVVRPGDFTGARRTIQNPASAYDGNRTMLVWYEWGGGIPSRLAGAFIERNGTVGQSFPVYEGLTDLYPVDIYAEVVPKVAYGNNRYLVVWNPPHRGHRDPGKNMSVYGQLIDLSGNQLLAPDSILQIRNDDGVVRPRFSDVASDGTDWVVAWIEGPLQDQAGRGEASFSVQAKRVTFDGAVENSGSAGTTVAGAFVVNPGTGSEEELTKEELNIAYHDERYYFVWAGRGVSKTNSSSVHRSNAATYISTSDGTLSDLTEQSVIAGKYGDHRGYGWVNPEFPHLVFSEDRGLATWGNGYSLEGWFVN